MPCYTKYNHKSTPTRVTIIRRHHPLEGRDFEVLTAGPTQVVVRVPDGTAMRIPRGWTDADGPARTVVVERVFSIESLLELIERIGALRRRA